MAEHAHTTPTPNTPPAAARRDLIAVCGAFLAIRGTAAARAQEPDTLAHPMPVFAGNADARLIALCARFNDLEAQREALPYDNEPGSPEEAAEQAGWQRCDDGQDELLAEMENNPPTTLAGFRAVAQSLIAWDEGALEGHGGVNDRPRGLILRTLLEERAA